MMEVDNHQPTSQIRLEFAMMEPECLLNNCCYLQILMTALFFFFAAAAVIVAGTRSKLWEVPAGHFTSSSNQTENLPLERCQTQRTEYEVKITADIPPKLDGTWVSTRYKCS